jgi:hypothetical protein
MDEYNPWMENLSYANQLSCYENLLIELNFKHTFIIYVKVVGCHL